MDLHVAAYGRQSYGRVNGSEASPASQRDANHAWCETFAAEAVRQGREARWCGHFEDVGISAYNGKERQSYARTVLGRIVEGRRTLTDDMREMAAAIHLEV